MGSKLSSRQEILVATIHENAATPDGTADAIAKMVARVRPVGLDTLPPHQGRRDFALGCSGQ